jgi:hypothetical protein
MLIAGSAPVSPEPLPPVAGSWSAIFMLSLQNVELCREPLMARRYRECAPSRA